MRVVFMGTPFFAAYQLEFLIENRVDVVGVVTMPDKPMGRGMKVGHSAVKEVALKHGLPILQPEKLKSPDFIDELQALKADLFVVVAFRMLPEVVWNMPKKGTLNLHASILPSYRGAAPINWAIMNGETETGVTTFFIQHEIDTGDVLLVDKVDISPEEDAGVLHNQLMEVGSKTILRTIEGIINESITPTPQVIPLSVVLPSAPKLTKENTRINWLEKNTSIYNKVRGLSPMPAAWSTIKLNSGKSLTVKFFKVIPVEDPIEVGVIKSDNKSFLHVGTGKGAISIEEFQLEGKKRMDIKAFLMGFDIGIIEGFE